MNYKHLLGAVLLLLVVGFTSYFYIGLTREPVPVLGNNPAPATTPPKFEAWHRQSKLPWEFDPKAASYHDPRLGLALQLIDREIRQIAKPHWHKLAPAHYPFTWADHKLGPDYSRTYEAHWYSVRNRDNNIQPPVEQQEYYVRLHLIESRPELRELQFRGQKLSIDSWSVEWRLYTQPLRLSFAELRVSHPVYCPEGISLRPGSQEYRYHEGNYNWVTTSLALRNDTNECRALNTSATFIELWRTPESFQEAAIAELDSHNLAIGQWFAAGGPVVRHGPQPGDGTKPPRLEDPQFAQLGLRLKLAVEAGTMNLIRRKVVMTHAAEMQQALHESFPAMLELLKLFPDTSPP